MFTVALFSLYRFFYFKRSNALQPLFTEKPWGRAQPQMVKKMAENFTLFAIEEEITEQMPKNIARRAKTQLYK